MLTREPAVVFGGLGEIAKAVIPVLVLGGFVGWDAKMVAAIMFLISVSVGSLSTMITRSQTVSNDTANKQIFAALQLPSSATVQEVVQKVADAQ